MDDFKELMVMTCPAPSQPALEPLSADVSFVPLDKLVEGLFVFDEAKGRKVLQFSFIEPMLGKGDDLQIAQWLISKNLSYELIFNLSLFSAPKEIIRLLIWSSPADGGIAMVPMDRAHGLADFTSKRMTQLIQNIASLRQACGPSEIANYTVMDLMNWISLERLSNEDYVFTLCEVIRAGYSNSINYSDLTVLNSADKAQVTQTLIAHQAWHQIIRFQNELELDLQVTLALLRALDDQRWYMHFVAKNTTAMKTEEVSQIIILLIEDNCVPQAIRLLIQKNPDRITTIFKSCFRSSRKIDLKSNAAIANIDLVPEDQRQEIARYAINQGKGQAIFPYWKDFCIPSDQEIELFKLGITQGVGHYIFTNPSELQLSPEDLQDLSDCAIDAGFGNHVIRTVEDLPNINLQACARRILDVAISDPKKRKPLHELVLKYIHNSEIRNSYKGSDTDFAREIAIDCGCFRAILDRVNQFADLDLLEFFDWIEIHNAYKEIILSGSVEKLGLTNEQQLSVCEKGLGLPRNYIETLMSMPQGESIILGISKLSSEKFDIVQALLAVADPEDNYSISPEKLLEFGRNKEILQAMENAGIDIQQWLDADPEIEFEIEDTSELCAQTLSDSIKQLTQESEGILKIFRDHLRSAPGKALLSSESINCPDGKTSSAEQLARQFRHCFASFKDWLGQLTTELESLKKEYDTVVKASLGPDGEALANQADDIQAQLKVAEVQKRGVAFVRRFQEMLKKMERRQKKALEGGKILQNHIKLLPVDSYDEIRRDTQRLISSCDAIINRGKTDIAAKDHHQDTETEMIPMKLHFAPKNLTTWFAIGSESSCCVGFEEALDYLLDIGVRLPVAENLKNHTCPYVSFYWPGKSFQYRSDPIPPHLVSDNIEGHPVVASAHKETMRKHFFTFAQRFGDKVNLPHCCLGTRNNDIPEDGLELLQLPPEPKAEGQGQHIRFHKIGGDVNQKNYKENEIPSSNSSKPHVFLEARDRLVFGLTDSL